MTDKKLITKQYTISPAAGKRLIAKALLQIPDILETLENRTLVIIAGTTNAYIAEEFLKKLGQLEGFSRKQFFRGITLPHNYIRTEARKAEAGKTEVIKSDTGNSKEEKKFLGDVVIVNGKWEKGKTIFEVADQLKEGDIIFKGANAVNLEENLAAILIGHPAGGTVIPILQCNIGRRVELYIPVGLEKRISANINEIAEMLNAANASGSRYMPVSGKIVTEIQAVKLLTGAEAELIASGGVCGAEGSYWLAVTGTQDELSKMDKVYTEVKDEDNYIL